MITSYKNVFWLEIYSIAASAVIRKSAKFPPWALFGHYITMWWTQFDDGALPNLWRKFVHQESDQIRTQESARFNSDLSSSLAVLMDGVQDRSLYLSRLLESWLLFYMFIISRKISFSSEPMSRSRSYRTADNPHGHLIYFVYGHY